MINKFKIHHLNPVYQAKKQKLDFVKQLTYGYGGLILAENKEVQPKSLLERTSGFALVCLKKWKKAVFGEDRMFSLTQF